MSVGILIALGIEAGIAAQVWAAGASGSYWTSLAAFWIVLVLI